MKNLDKLKQMTSEQWAEFFTNYNICPYRFGSKRRGKYKTCPYPMQRPDECKQCWIEWLEKKC